MSLGTMEERTEGMKRQSQELIEQAYNRGYKAGYEKAYEEQKQKEDAEITVGDEVYLIDKNHTRVVTCIFCENGDYKKAVQITESGRWVVDKISEIHKTGRHFDAIEEVLKKMQEETNES